MYVPHVAVQSGNVGRAETAAGLLIGAPEGVLLHVEVRQRGRVSLVNRVHVRHTRVEYLLKRPGRPVAAQGTPHPGQSHLDSLSNRGSLQMILGSYVEVRLQLNQMTLCFGVGLQDVADR